MLNLSEERSFLRRFILRVFYSAGTNFCGSRSIHKIRKNKNPQNFHATRYMLSVCATLLGALYNGLYADSPPKRGTFFRLEV